MGRAAAKMPNYGLREGQSRLREGLDAWNWPVGKEPIAKTCRLFSVSISPTDGIASRVRLSVKAYCQSLINAASNVALTNQYLPGLNMEPH